jgi:ABC-type polar amino acid transport system ATPase subunit
MRLESAQIRDTPPVRLFEVGNLGDVVVIAGPNGVGKTRLLQRIVNHLRGAGIDPGVQLVVTSTSAEERSAWGKDTLVVSDPGDLSLLVQTIQASRRRRNWTSSLINFESDRSIQNLQPLQFAWDMPDPTEEAVSWDSTFGLMRDRHQDTLHSMFRMIEVQKQSIASRAIQLKRDGHDSMNLTFQDPMEPFKEVFAMLLSPKTMADPSPRTQQLEYQIDGQTFNFTSLSSGEHEVVNIAFDFLLRRPQDCIVFFDEPELHLHPELSYKLLNTLRRIGARNQFVLSTHSPDIITASLDQSVIFLSAPRDDENGAPENQAIEVSEADETNQALRMLGQSIGVVALGKRLVLVEGTQSSIDKQTYGSIVGARFPDLVLVPSGGKRSIESFETVYEDVLRKTIWGVEFFMVCDRDSGPIPSDTTEAAEQEGRLRILPRYHVENYFLEEAVWADVFRVMEPEDSWLRDPVKIRSLLDEIAREFVSVATALTVSRELRQSIGNVDCMPKDCHNASSGELSDLLVARAATELGRVSMSLDETLVRARTTSVYEDLTESITTGTNKWKNEIPGKPVLSIFAHRAGLQLGRAKSLYIAAADTAAANPFQDVVSIFEDFRSSSY